MHTKGPWIVDCAGIVTTTYPVKRIASISPAGMEADAEDIANAHLIAQAPEMAELIRWYATSKGKPDLDGSRARALLAKIG